MPELTDIPVPAPADDEVLVRIHSADLVFLKQLIEAGRLRNVIGRTYSLGEIAQAHRYAQSGHKVGNVAVIVK